LVLTLSAKRGSMLSRREQRSKVYSFWSDFILIFFPVLSKNEGVRKKDV